MADRTLMYKIIGTDGKEYGPIDSEGLRQWICQGRLHAQSLVRLDGAGEWQPLRTLPEFALLIPTTPSVAGGGDPMPQTNDAVATIIPYRNPKALIAYYLGLFSLFPFLGFFLGVAAFILGLQGLGLARKHPETKGKVHAWIGVLCGGIFGLFNMLLILLLIVSIAASRH
jgi:GYF domain 2